MAKSNSKKQLAQKQQNPSVLLLVGCVLAAIAYGFASWAIESGSIFVYAATFVTAYVCVRYIVKAFTLLIRK